MMKNNKFYQQVKLMLQLLPIVAEEKCFALKGGTAINFFIRDLPRYSVDIDLTYVHFQERADALKNLAKATENIAKNIEKRLPSLKVVRKYTKQTNRLVKLFVNSKNTQVKIEPNELVRGAVYPCEQRTITKSAEKEFGGFVSMQTLSIPDLYAGKFCAALDRQHPRDLFDVKLLLENEGITDDIRKAFVVYLASHNRPISELLSPNLLDIKSYYDNDFDGMARAKVSFNEIISIRKRFIAMINQALMEDERKFLLSLKMCEPQWSLLDIPSIEKFPAIKWKLLNIEKMSKNKHRLAVEKLKRVLRL
ncbi:MAG: nucleotidyl transferase AbiEii/AbiGii toxin family protein [Gammaproteobacteria bacterium]|jgi:predicted nucleotidyltransferase component of viral defense system